jgi:hypothetical protein
MPTRFFTYDWLMNRWRFLMLAFVAVACTTKSNPAKYCETGTCIDPAYPFCDVTGAVGGEAASLCRACPEHSPSVEARKKFGAMRPATTWR